MNHQLYAFLALDLARERAQEADRYRQVALLNEGKASGVARLRRWLAQAIAAASRLAIGIVRKLDSCIADDLGRSLAPTE
jgi:hypothetical protein